MPEIIKFLQCTPNILRFMPQKDITLNELQSLFHMSRKHWNQHTDFDQKQLQKNKIYTLSFKAVSSHVALSDKEVTIVYEDMFCVVAFKPCFTFKKKGGSILVRPSTVSIKKPAVWYFFQSFLSFSLILITKLKVIYLKKSTNVL